MTTDVPISSLRYRLALEAPVRTSDDAGGVIETWNAIAHFWAGIDTLSGFESYTAGAVSGRLTHAIFVRARSDITPALRLRSGQRIFDIRSVTPEGDPPRHLRVLCEERNL